MDLWTSDLNYFAVVVATVASMMVGSLWYSPILFANPWLRLIGKTSEELKEKGYGQVPAYSTAIVSALIVAYVMALVIEATESTTLADGIIVALWLWLGFVATTSLLAVVFDGRPIRLWAINMGNHLVSFVLMGLIIGVWQ